MIQDAQQWESHRVAGLLQASIGVPCASPSAEQQPLKTGIGYALKLNAPYFAVSPELMMKA